VTSKTPGTSAITATVIATEDPAGHGPPRFPAPGGQHEGSSPFHSHLHPPVATADTGRTGLGIGVSATTVANVLRRAGLGPAPRRIGPSWSQFLRAQAESLVGGGLDSGLADGLEQNAGAASRRLTIGRPQRSKPTSARRPPSFGRLLSPGQGQAAQRPRRREHRRVSSHAIARTLATDPDMPVAGPVTAERAEGASSKATGGAASAPISATSRPAESPRSFGRRAPAEASTAPNRPEFLYPTP
jgi:hypothetical protein